MKFRPVGAELLHADGTKLIASLRNLRTRLKPIRLMLYRVIISVCSEIHTKHRNTLCRQNVEFVNVKLVVHIVTTGL